MKIRRLTALALAAFLTTSCATTTAQEQRYMAIGAGAGAATIVLLGTPFSGVIVGAAAGGAAGYAYFHHSGAKTGTSGKSEMKSSSKSD